MTDETTPVVPPSTTEEPRAVETPAVEPTTEPTTTPTPAPVAATPTWQDELAKLDPKEFRRAVNEHSGLAGVVGGIIGAETQRAIQTERERIKADEGAKAAKQAEEELQRLAQEDPVTFAEKWLSKTQQDRIQRQFAELRDKTRSEYAERIGRAYRDLPGWADLTTEEHEELVKSVLGKPEDDVLPTFAHTAFGMLLKKGVQKGAQALHEEWKAKELEKQREAIHQEEAAKLMAKTIGPDGAKPKGSPARLNVAAMSDDEFDKWYAKDK